MIEGVITFGLLALLFVLMSGERQKPTPAPYLGVNGEADALESLAHWRRFKETNDQDDKKRAMDRYCRAQRCGYEAFVAFIRSKPDGDELWMYMEGLND